MTMVEACTVDGVKKMAIGNSLSNEQQCTTVEDKEREKVRLHK